MAEPAVIFFDVGGVLLSNGWDRTARGEACREFGLDWEDFQDRHDFMADSFERGETGLDTYLARTVFYRDRGFSKDDFFEFIKSRSTAMDESLELLGRLSASGRYLLATLNNESREINEYRIDTFGLRDHFEMFLSSCYMGVRKPGPEIYKMAVDIVQRNPQECIFVDDRPLNLECAALAGITPIHFRDATTLQHDLTVAGVEI